MIWLLWCLIKVGIIFLKFLVWSVLFGVGWVLGVFGFELFVLVFWMMVEFGVICLCGCIGWLVFFILFVYVMVLIGMLWVCLFVCWRLRVVWVVILLVFCWIIFLFVFIVFLLFIILLCFKVLWIDFVKSFFIRWFFLLVGGLGFVLNVFRLVIFLILWRLFFLLFWGLVLIVMEVILWVVVFFVEGLSRILFCLGIRSFLGLDFIKFLVLFFLNNWFVFVILFLYELRLKRLCRLLRLKLVCCFGFLSILLDRNCLKIWWW